MPGLIVMVGGVAPAIAVGSITPHSPVIVPAIGLPRRTLAIVVILLGMVTRYRLSIAAGAPRAGTIGVGAIARRTILLAAVLSGSIVILTVVIRALVGVTLAIWPVTALAVATLPIVILAIIVGTSVVGTVAIVTIIALSLAAVLRLRLAHRQAKAEIVFLGHVFAVIAVVAIIDLRITGLSPLRLVLVGAVARLADDTEIMIRELKVIFGQHAIAGLLRITRQRLVFLEHLRRVAPRAAVDTVAVVDPAPTTLRTLVPTTATPVRLTIVDQIDVLAKRAALSPFAPRTGIAGNLCPAPAR